jgi:hypothetical protein
MQPLCNATDHAHIGRHRDCPSCGHTVTGPDARYVAHTWHCPGRRG